MFMLFCSSRKYQYPTGIYGIGNSGGHGGQKKNKLTEFVWQEKEFPESGGVHLQIPSLVGNGYFLELHIIIKYSSKSKQFQNN